MDQSTPGPGRYDPSIHYCKYNNQGAGYLGIKLKTSGIIDKRGTDGENIGPTSYEIAEKSNRHKFPYSPKYSFGLDNRKSLGKKIETKNETYSIVNSCGKQVIAFKQSQPEYSFSKSSRFNNN